MAKYRKKPVVIEAKCFTTENKDRVYTWAQQIQMNVSPTFDEFGKPAIAIPTSEGVMLCQLGDYLIWEPFPIFGRWLYPCKPDIFEKTYEPVSGLDSNLKGHKVRLRPSVVKYLLENGTVVNTNNRGYYYIYLPFWHKIVIGSNVAEIYSLGNLPEDLTEQVKLLRGE